MVSLQRIKNLCTLSITLLLLFSLQLNSLRAMNDDGKEDEKEPIGYEAIVAPVEIWNEYERSRAGMAADHSVMQQNAEAHQKLQNCQNSSCPVSDWDMGSYFVELSAALEDIGNTTAAFKLQDLSEELKESDPETYSLLLDDNNILAGYRAERTQHALVLFYDFYCKYKNPINPPNRRADLIRFFQEWVPNGPLLLIEKKHDYFALAMRLNHIITRVGLTEDERNTLKNTQLDDDVHLLLKYLLTAFEGEGPWQEKLAEWGRESLEFQRFKKRISKKYKERKITKDLTSAKDMLVHFDFWQAYLTAAVDQKGPEQEAKPVLDKLDSLEDDQAIKTLMHHLWKMKVDVSQKPHAKLLKAEKTLLDSYKKYFECDDTLKNLSRDLYEETKEDEGFIPYDIKASSLGKAREAYQNRARYQKEIARLENDFIESRKGISITKERQAWVNKNKSYYNGINVVTDEHKKVATARRARLEAVRNDYYTKPSAQKGTSPLSPFYELFKGREEKDTPDTLVSFFERWFLTGPVAETFKDDYCYLVILWAELVKQTGHNIKNLSGSLRGGGDTINRLLHSEFLYEDIKGKLQNKITERTFATFITKAWQEESKKRFLRFENQVSALIGWDSVDKDAYRKQSNEKQIILNTIGRWEGTTDAWFALQEWTDYIAYLKRVATTHDKGFIANVEQTITEYGQTYMDKLKAFERAINTPEGILSRHHAWKTSRYPEIKKTYDDLCNLVSPTIKSFIEKEVAPIFTAVKKKAEVLKAYQKCEKIKKSLQEPGGKPLALMSEKQDYITKIIKKRDQYNDTLTEAKASANQRIDRASKKLLKQTKYYTYLSKQCKNRAPKPICDDLIAILFNANTYDCDTKEAFVTLLKEWIIDGPLLNVSTDTAAELIIKLLIAMDDLGIVEEEKKQEDLDDQDDLDDKDDAERLLQQLQACQKIDNIVSPGNLATLLEELEGTLDVGGNYDMVALAMAQKLVTQADIDEAHIGAQVDHNFNHYEEEDETVTLTFTLANKGESKAFGQYYRENGFINVQRNGVTITLSITGKDLYNHPKEILLNEKEDFASKVIQLLMNDNGVALKNIFDILEHNNGEIAKKERAYRAQQKALDELEKEKYPTTIVGQQMLLKQVTTLFKKGKTNWQQMLGCLTNRTKVINPNRDIDNIIEAYKDKWTEKFKLTEAKETQERNYRRNPLLWIYDHYLQKNGKRGMVNDLVAFFGWVVQGPLTIAFSQEPLTLADHLTDLIKEAFGKQSEEAFGIADTEGFFNAIINKSRKEAATSSEKFLSAFCGNYQIMAAFSDYYLNLEYKGDEAEAKVAITTLLQETQKDVEKALRVKWGITEDKFKEMNNRATIERLFSDKKCAALGGFLKVMPKEYGLAGAPAHRKSVQAYKTEMAQFEKEALAPYRRVGSSWENLIRGFDVTEESTTTLQDFEATLDITKGLLKNKVVDLIPMNDIVNGIKQLKKRLLDNVKKESYDQWLLWMSGISIENEAKPKEPWTIYIYCNLDRELTILIGAIILYLLLFAPHTKRRVKDDKERVFKPIEKQLRNELQAAQQQRARIERAESELTKAERGDKSYLSDYFIRYFLPEARLKRARRKQLAEKKAYLEICIQERKEAYEKALEYSESKRSGLLLILHRFTMEVHNLVFSWSLLQGTAIILLDSNRDEGNAHIEEWLWVFGWIIMVPWVIIHILAMAFMKEKSEIAESKKILLDVIKGVVVMPFFALPFLFLAIKSKNATLWDANLLQSILRVIKGNSSTLWEAKVLKNIILALIGKNTTLWGGDLSPRNIFGRDDLLLFPFVVTGGFTLVTTFVVQIDTHNYLNNATWYTRAPQPLPTIAT